MFHVSKETKRVIPLANSLLQYTFQGYRAHRSYSQSDKEVTLFLISSKKTYQHAEATEVMYTASIYRNLSEPCHLKHTSYNNCITQLLYIFFPMVDLKVSWVKKHYFHFAGVKMRHLLNDFQIISQCIIYSVYLTTLSKNIIMHLIVKFKF